MSIVQVILMASPIALFVCKDFLPFIYMLRYSKGTCSVRQIFDVFVKLSIDYLFAALSYILPKCLESFYVCQELNTEISRAVDILQREELLAQQATELTKVIQLAILSFIIIFLSPFLVLANEVAFKFGESGYKIIKWGIVLIVYAICLWVCYYATRLY